MWGRWVVVAAVLLQCHAGPTVKMKVITAPPPTVQPTLGKINRDHVKYDLKPRVIKSNFSGPQELYTLYGQCFPDVIGNYEWRVCPFDNVTQHEVNSGAWNSFNGIIGVWKGYDVNHGVLDHMTFDHGDNCAGNKMRSAKVEMKCGNVTRTVSATEPAPCAYEIVLETPLACNSSLNLSTILNEESLAKIHKHDQALQDGELTALGHKVRIMRTLEQAGVQPGPPVPTTISPTAQPTHAMHALTSTAAPTATIAPTPPPLNYTRLFEDCSADKLALQTRVTELSSEVLALQERLDSIFSLSGGKVSSVRTPHSDKKRAASSLSGPNNLHQNSDQKPAIHSYEFGKVLAKSRSSAHHIAKPIQERSAHASHTNGKRKAKTIKSGKSKTTAKPHGKHQILGQRKPITVTGTAATPKAKASKAGTALGEKKLKSAHSGVSQQHKRSQSTQKVHTTQAKPTQPRTKPSLRKKHSKSAHSVTSQRHARSQSASKGPTTQAKLTQLDTESSLRKKKPKTAQPGHKRRQVARKGPTTLQAPANSDHKSTAGQKLHTQSTAKAHDHVPSPIGDHHHHMPPPKKTKLHKKHTQ